MMLPMAMDVSDYFALSAGVLLDTTLKATAILLLAWGGALGARRASAAGRHMLWTAAVVGVLLLPLLSLALPAWRVLPWMPQWRALGESTVPASRVTNPPALTEAPASVSPMPVEGASRMPVLDPVPLTPASPSPMPVVPTAAVPVPSAAPLSLAALIVWTWLAGVGCMAVPLLASLVFLWRAQRRAVAVDPAWRSLLDELRQGLGLRRGITLVQSSRGLAPMTFGILRPVILVPANAWSPRRWRIVLLHELAHIQRRDCLTQYLARLIRVMFWFHPLAWLACTRMAMEAERACDDRVLAAGTRSSAYAEELISIASSFNAHPALAAAALTMARSSTLETRVVGILDMGRNRRGLTRKMVLAALVVAVCVAVPLACMKDGAAKAAGPHESAWGQPVGGLALMIRTDKEQYEVGDKIRVRFLLKNTAPRDVTPLYRATDPEPWFCDFASVQNEQGNEIPKVRAPLAEPILDEVTKLAAGQQIVLSVDLSQWKLAGLGHAYTSIGDESRTIVLSGCYCLPLSSGMQAVTSGPLKIVVAARPGAAPATRPGAGTFEDLVRQAIAAPVAKWAPRSGEWACTSPMGLDLTAMLTQSGQAADFNALINEQIVSAQLEGAVKRLAAEKKVWVLAALLNQDRPDMQINAAIGLEACGDVRAVPALLVAAKANNYTVAGSENATANRAYRDALMRAMGNLTGLRGQELSIGQVEKWLAEKYLGAAATRPALADHAAAVAELVKMVRAGLPAGLTVQSESGEFTPVYWSKEGKGVELRIGLPQTPGAMSKPTGRYWLMEAGYDGVPPGAESQNAATNPAMEWGLWRGGMVICQQMPEGVIRDVLAKALGATDSIGAAGADFQLFVNAFRQRATGTMRWVQRRDEMIRFMGPRRPVGLNAEGRMALAERGDELCLLAGWRTSNPAMRIWVFHEGTRVLPGAVSEDGTPVQSLGTWNGRPVYMVGSAWDSAVAEVKAALAATENPGAAPPPVIQKPDTMAFLPVTLEDMYYQKLYARYKAAILADAQAGNTAAVTKTTTAFFDSLGGKLLYASVMRIDGEEKYTPILQMNPGNKAVPAIKYSSVGLPHVTKLDDYVLLETSHDLIVTTQPVSTQPSRPRYADNIYIKLAFTPMDIRIGKSGSAIGSSEDIIRDTGVVGMGAPNSTDMTAKKLAAWYAAGKAAPPGAIPMLILATRWVDRPADRVDITQVMRDGDTLRVSADMLLNVDNPVASQKAVTYYSYATLPDLPAGTYQIDVQYNYRVKNKDGTETPAMFTPGWYPSSAQGRFILSSDTLAQPATTRTGTQTAPVTSTAPATQAANGRRLEDEPGWSKEVDGLKVQLTGGKYLAPKLGLEVSLRFWNTSGTVLAIAPGDPSCFKWELRDAKDQIVTPEKPAVEAPPNPGWMYLSPAQSGIGRILGQSSENRDGTLRVGNQHWKLKAGTYALHGTFSNPANADGQRTGILWMGQMDLVPLTFTVVDAVTPEALKAAADKINAQNIADLGQRYTALAALIQPGMTYADLQIVLPPVKGDVGIMMWNGGWFMGRYHLDGGYMVEAISGHADAAANNNGIILTQPPKIIPPQPATKP